MQFGYSIGIDSQRLVLYAALLLGVPACQGRAGCRSHDPAVSAAARGDALLAAARPFDAIKAYRSAPKSGATNAVTRGLGLALTSVRDWQEATTHLLPYAAAHPQDSQVRLALAVALVGSGETKQARIEAANLADAKPDLLTAQLLTAALANTAPLRQQALRRLERWEQHGGAAVAGHPATPSELFITRGILLLALDDEPNARATFERAASATVSDAHDACWVATAFLRTAQVPAAERLLIRVTEAVPKFEPAWRMLAEVAIELDHHDRALVALDRLSATSLTPVDHMLRARAEIGMNQTQAAIDRLRPLLPVLERDKLLQLASRARLLLAKAQRAAGRLDDACATLTAATYPGSSLEAGLALADVELARDQPDAAIAVLQRLALAHPNNNMVRAMLGSAYLKKKLPSDAEAVFRAYATDQPNDPRAHHLLGMALEVGGRLDAARTAYGRALEVAPGSVPPLVSLLALIQNADGSAAADALLRSQITAVPGSGTLHRMLGERLEARGDQVGAEAAYNAALNGDGDNEQALIAIGEFYGRTQRPVRALEVLKVALERAPDNPDALARAASMDQKLGHRESAIARYERGLARRPNDAGMLNNLALLLVEDPQHLVRAEQLARAASKADPKSPYVADTLGWVLFRRGQVEEALPLLEGSAAALGDNAEVLIHVGMVRLAAGRNDEGRRSLAQALAIDPEVPGSREAREALAPPSRGSRP